MTTQPRAPEWIAEIDWDSNGDFTGAYDDISSRLLDAQGLTYQHGRDAARALGQPMVLAGAFAARNDDRFLSAEYAGSPIYGLMQPGRPARIRARVGLDVDMDDATVDMDAFDVGTDGSYIFGALKGVVDEMDQHPEIGDRSVGFQVLGSTLKLRGGAAIYTPLRQNYRTDQAVTEILDAIGWPAGDRVISVGDTTMAWWWLNGSDAFSALTDLLYTEGAGAAIYEDGDGKVHFESRNYRGATLRSSTVQSTWADFEGADYGVDDSALDMDSALSFLDGGVGAYWFTASGYRPEQKSIINDVVGTAKNRAAQTLAKVWEYGQTITLTAGQSQTVYATGSDPWTGVVTPALTTDYTLTGTATVSVSVVVNAQRVAITFSAGGSGSVTIAGPGGAATGPQLRAQPVTVTSTTQVPNTVTGAVQLSRDKYGSRSADGTNWAPRNELTPANMQAVVDALCAYHAEPRPVVPITVRNADARYLWEQMQRQVSDRIRIYEGHTGIYADFWVEQISQRAARDVVETTLLCQKAFDANVALWDQSLWDGGDGKKWGL